MKYYLMLFSIVLISCSNTDDVLSNPITCKLTNVEFSPLLFDYIPNYTPDIISPNNEGFTFEYDDSGKITTIAGGPVRVPTGSGIEWIYSTFPIYNVSYNNSSVIIDSQIETIDEDNTNQYIIIDQKIVSKTIIETLDYFTYQVTEYTYEYFDDHIVEYRADELNRTYYFENNNLKTVETLYYYGENNPNGTFGSLAGKFEITFSEFDDTINLMKGLFFVDGGFYKAFSQNNYHEISFTNYEYVDNEFIANSLENVRGFNFGLNEDGSNGMFKQLCD